MDELIWNREPVTKEGYYWFRNYGHKSKQILVEIIETEAGLAVKSGDVFGLNKQSQTLEALKETWQSLFLRPEWAGPIPEPKD